MPPAPLSQDWPGRHALLVVHGVGNASPGDYAPLVASFQQLLGEDAAEYAIYELYYDAYNDWMNDKIPLARGIEALKEALKEGFGGDDLADAVAEFAGDVIWPVLHLAPRAMIREAYLAQLKQIVRDGIRAGVGVWNQRISIVCRSLGCFHTYEALHAAASDPQHALRPLSNGVTFANVVYMASPVQLIRSVAGRIRALVPKPDELATLRGDHLASPGQPRLSGGLKRSVERWVSIGGELDPVCGYVYRRRVDRYWMEVDGQETIVDPQHALNVGSKAELAALLRASVQARSRPEIDLQNPHSWQGYVDRHTAELRQWLLA